MPQYIKEKLKILKQMHIFLTKEEKQYLKQLKTEIAVDSFARSLIEHRFSEDW